MAKLIGIPPHMAKSAHAQATGPMITESDAQNFAGDVLQVSSERAVLVVFWASWCKICMSLKPRLEAEVRKNAGNVAMVTIDAEKHKALAAQFRIQSLPTVYAFVNGAPVDGFAGDPGKAEVAHFVLKLAQMTAQLRPLEENIADQLKAAAQALQEGTPARALEIYSQILSQEPEQAEALVGRVRALLASGKLASARKAFTAFPQVVGDSAAAHSLACALELAAEMAPYAAQHQALSRKNAQTPEQLYDLARALLAIHQKEEAAETLLQIMAAHPKWEDEKARALLLRGFEAWGESDPLTAKLRRRLSSLLFS